MSRRLNITWLRNGLSCRICQSRSSHDWDWRFSFVIAKCSCCIRISNELKNCIGEPIYCIRYSCYCWRRYSNEISSKESCWKKQKSDDNEFDHIAWHVLLFRFVQLVFLDYDNGNGNEQVTEKEMRWKKVCADNRLPNLGVTRWVRDALIELSDERMDRKRKEFWCWAVVSMTKIWQSQQPF